MSNFDRAVKVLDSQGAYCGQCSREPGDSLDACRDCAAVLETYAHALEAAGLLAPDFAHVTRLTVVGGAGRLFETWGITNVAVVLQDDGRTLKIFYREERGNE